MAKLRLLEAKCPKCNTADNVQNIYDYERNLQIFNCRTCGESFAVLASHVASTNHCGGNWLAKCVSYRGDTQ